jgi:hypothetical protein
MTMTRFVGAAVLIALCHAVPAAAGAIQLGNPSDLSAGAIAGDYPLGPPGDPLNVDVGAVTLSFSTPGFLFLDMSDGSNYDFPAGTSVLGTLPDGPMTVDFSSGVREVGLFAQGVGPSPAESFSFSVFQGATSLGTFAVGPADNSSLPGIALFLGARATGGDLITSMVINNTSPVDDFFDNSFVIGPVAFSEAAAAEPVPEPMSLLLFGTGLVGVSVRLRRKPSA